MGRLIVVYHGHVSLGGPTLNYIPLSVCLFVVRLSHAFSKLKYEKV